MPAFRGHKPWSKNDKKKVGARCKNKDHTSCYMLNCSCSCHDQYRAPRGVGCAG